MTLTADYKDWLAVQPLTTIQSELAKAKQVVGELEQAPDLRTGERKTLLKVWRRRYALLRQTLALRGFDPKATRYGPAPMPEGVDDSRPPKVLASMLITPEGRVMFGKYAGKDSSDVVGDFLEAASPGDLCAIEVTEPKPVWYLLGAKARRLIIRLYP